MMRCEALAVIGSLGHPSKMPGLSYGIPAQACKLGALLARQPGTVCSGCYALKGNYRYNSVRIAQERRLAGLRDPRWVDAMVQEIAREQARGEVPYFRWHDAGDLQGAWHLDLLARVALALPAVRFWLPTREYGMVGEWLRAHPEGLPVNLVVRLSAHKLDVAPPEMHGLPGSGVTTARERVTCPAPQQGNACQDCRACWDPSVRVVWYKKH